MNSPSTDTLPLPRRLGRLLPVLGLLLVVTGIGWWRVWRACQGACGPDQTLDGIVNTLALWGTTGLAVVLTLRMQSLAQQQQAQAFAAQHDGLTGLKNRNALNAHIGELVQAAQTKPTRFAMLLVGIHDFQAIQDAHGAAVADAVLKAVAGRVQNCARSVDLVARLDGNGLVIVCHDVQLAGDVQKLMDRIDASLVRPVVIDRLKLAVRVSMGLALYPDHGTHTDELLMAADQAMRVGQFGR